MKLEDVKPLNTPIKEFEGVDAKETEIVLSAFDMLQEYIKANKEYLLRKDLNFTLSDNKNEKYFIISKFDFFSKSESVILNKVEFLFQELWSYCKETNSFESIDLTVGHNTFTNNLKKSKIVFRIFSMSFLEIEKTGINANPHFFKTTTPKKESEK